MSEVLSWVGSWGFIIGGTMLLVLSAIGGGREKTGVRVTQALVGLCGVAAGVLRLLN